MGGGDTPANGRGRHTHDDAQWRDMQPNDYVHRIAPSPNFGARARPITMLVVHYTEMKPV